MKKKKAKKEGDKKSDMLVTREGSMGKKKQIQERDMYLHFFLFLLVRFMSVYRWFKAALTKKK